MFNMAKDDLTKAVGKLFRIRGIAQGNKAWHNNVTKVALFFQLVKGGEIVQELQQTEDAHWMDAI